MDRIKEFSKKNLKYLAMGIVAILFVLATFFSFGLLNSSKGETLSAEISGYWIDSASSKFAGGSGSASDPYLISSPEEFACLANKINNGNITVHNHYKVTKPINLSLKYWTPIGINGRYFKGSIDFGNNPVIGLTVNGDYEASGLFGNVDSLTITNAIIIDATITVSNDTGSVGIIAGTVNNSSGVISITNSTIKGSVTHNGTYPSTKDGIGGLIGSILEASSVTLSNLSTNISIQAPNRSVNTCIGAYVGYIKSGITNTITNVVATGEIKTKNSTTIIKRYIGDFTSDWFYMDGLNGGVPVLKSQYWIGKNKTLTGSQITTQLGALGYSSSSKAGVFIPETTLYTITTKTSITNGNPNNRTGFSVTANTRTGSNYAVEGEQVSLTNSTIGGYSFDKYIVNNTDVSNNFIMSKADVIVTGQFSPVSYTMTLADEFTNKRIIYSNPTSTTKNGLTITNNGDNTITLNGTVTADTGISDEPIMLATTNGTTFNNKIGLVAGDKVRLMIKYLGGSFTHTDNNNKAQFVMDFKNSSGLSDFSYTDAEKEKLNYSIYSTSKRIMSAQHVFPTSSLVCTHGYDYVEKDSNGNTVKSTYITESVISSATTVRFWIWKNKGITFNNYKISLGLVEVSGENLVTLKEEYDKVAENVTIPSSDGYTFAGYYTQPYGAGVQVINTDGTFRKGVSGYTDANGRWIRASATLYAKWIEHKFTINYNLNGTYGTSSYTDIAVASGQGFNNTSPGRVDTGYWETVLVYGLHNPLSSRITRRGYTITGTGNYNTKADGSGIDIHMDTVKTVQEIASLAGVLSNLKAGDTAITIYLQWVPNIYNITYDYAGGALASGKTNPTSYTFSQSAQTKTLVAPTKTGYTFAGWTASVVGSVTDTLTTWSNTSTPTATNTVLTIPANVLGTISLTANWRANTYTITYNLNENSDARITDTSKEVTFNATVGTFAIPFSLGYTFQGWSTSSTGSANISDASGACKTLANYIDSSKNWVKASDITVYAIWKVNSYTLNLNANGGALATSTASTYTKQYGTSITIADPSRTGYTFAGWVATKTINSSEWAQILYHNSVAGTKPFASSDNLATTAKNDLYRNAQFSMLGKLGLSQYEFLLQYDSLPGKYNQWKQTSNPATSTSVTGYSAVHIDWTVNSWAGIAQSSSTTSTFIDGSPSASSWFYALGAYVKWNGGVPAASTAEQDRINLWLKTDSTLSNFKPTATFINNDALGSNNTYYFKAEEVTLKALWIANKYEVAFDGIYPTPFTELYSYKRDNSSWSTTSTNGVYEYKFNTGTLTEGATSSGPHLGGFISYLTNGEMYRIRFSIKASQAISGLPYRFEAAKNWNQKTINVTTSYQDCYSDFVYDNTAKYSHLTFYYSQMPDNVTITFKNITLSKLVTYDSTYGTLPTPTRTGYTFNGWYTASSGGTQVTESTKVAITEKQTLYAQWTPNVYTITLDNQDATSTGSTAIYEKYADGYYTSSSATSSYKMSKSANSIATIPSKTDYTFWGFYTSTNGGGTQYINSSGYLTSSASSTKFTANGTLYAYFRERSGDWTSYVEEPILEDKTYKIYSAENLAWVAKQCNNGTTFSGYTIKLMDNIELEQHNWVPIGLNSDKYFAGNFDGNDQYIYGMNISSSYTYIGLFGYVKGPEGDNVTFSNIYSSSADTLYIAGDGKTIGVFIASGENVTINNCRNNASIKLEDSTNGGLYDVELGAIIGSANSVIINKSSNTGTIKVTASDSGSLFLLYMGGIVGCCINTSISTSYNSASINLDYSNCSIAYVGGIAGGIVKTSVNNCYNSGSITSTGDQSYAGGVIGACSVSSSSERANSLQKCYNRGSVGASSPDFNSFAGGIIGNALYLTMTDCFNITDTIEGTNKGAIAALISYSTMKYLYYDSSLFTGSAYSTNSDSTISYVKGVADLSSKVKDSANFGTAAFDSSTGAKWSTAWDFTDTWQIESKVNSGYPSLKWQGTGSCLVEGTKVTLADGTEKNIEDITYDDLLLVWSPEKGTYDYQHPAWIEKESISDEYYKITLENGSELKVVLDHGIYSASDNQFINISAYKENLIGKEIVYIERDEFGNYVNKTAKVVGFETIIENVKYYHVVSSKEYNIFANGILTTDDAVIFSNRYGFDENMMWDNALASMVKESGTGEDGYLYDYSLFEDIMPQYLFESLNIAEGRYLVECGYLTFEEFRGWLLDNVLNPKLILPPEIGEEINGG